MKFQFAVSVAVAVLALQACSAPADPVAAEAPVPAGMPAEAPAPAQVQAASIVLDAVGLTVDGATVAIGASKVATVAAVTAAIGGPPAVTDAFEECGAGPMDHVSWDNGLHLLFQQDAFAGWQTTAPDLSTAGGIHVGSTLAALQAAYPGVAIEQDTIGWYFTAGGIDGYLDEAKAVIQRLNVGVTCDAT
ncbi:hypothetical protein [Brevundimonas subvibrioides]|uniref:Uncharacterized protein n=1 Tax=Brevundimonas subvibrioides (strain ATCC 15264 / DSM 4735 / LMG 14903 / NBRC 16000 / CB 81) TaxID=633149 RepID=D9QMR9_BRESC|nr:hypothetical protein [Brevundimonas subvibrioides]ADL02075.1 conserved hypothetical protein [Brevundimonas subvibrioides ATCC 15264]